MTSEKETAEELLDGFWKFKGYKEGTKQYLDTDKAKIIGRNTYLFVINNLASFCIKKIVEAREEEREKTVSVEIQHVPKEVSNKIKELAFKDGFVDGKKEIAKEIIEKQREIELLQSSTLTEKNLNLEAKAWRELIKKQELFLGGEKK